MTEGKYELQNPIKLISVFGFHKEQIFFTVYRNYVIDANFLWVKMCSSILEKFTADVTFTDPNLL